jgi:hypothetical protein
MPDWVPALLIALPIAGALAASQLINDEYPNTWFLFTPRKCKAFYGYLLLWGSVAFALAIAFDSLVARDIVKIKGLKLESPWVQALIVGLTAKALTQISIYNFTYGPRTLPVGPSLVLQPLEPLLLKKIKQCEASELQIFVDSRAQKYADVSHVREKIKTAPSDLTGPERLAFEEEIEDAQSVKAAMEKHVSTLGKKSFDAAFPPEP